MSYQIYFILEDIDILLETQLNPVVRKKWMFGKTDMRALWQRRYTAISLMES